MRIIGGSRRGRKLVEWQEGGIRPMRDFVRGALFNILADIVLSAAFLDLYSGTGSVGLEALSRGAHSCTFVDASTEACAIVRRNLDALDFLSVGQVFEGDSLRVIDELKRRGRRYDVIFIGPPYYRELVPTTLAALGDGRLLTDDPVVVGEIHRTEQAGEVYGVLTLVDARRYGDNRLLFYRTDGEPSGVG
jgi:16S rRNA (guanine966-N2)-methyltransferase